MSRLANFVRLGLGAGLLLTVGSARSIAEPTIHPSIERMKKDMTYLAGEECEGRGVETEGINKAATYIAAQFKAMGLKPAMPAESYFQSFKIAGFPKLGSPNHLIFKGPKSLEIAPKIDADYSVSGLTGKGKVEAGIVFVGYGITVGEKDYDDYRGIDVKDKIVMILRQTPRPGNTKTPFHADADQYAPLAVKLANAQKHKAAAAIFINDRERAGKTDDLMSFDYARGSGAATFPVVQIRRTLADRILATGDKTLAGLETEIDKDLKPQSFEIAGWKADVETTVDRIDLQAKNIIGVLEGAGPLAQETVVIGAHYDHLGRGERGSLAKGSKAIHYGADDNGSGTTTVIELARRFAAQKDRQGRRLVFMLFSGEERGLLGSAYYCKEPVFPLKDTVAMINLDMVGRLRPDDDTKEDKLEIGGVGSAKSFNALIDQLNEKFKFKLKKTKSGTGPSDHTSFYVKGVPVFFFFTGFHNEYHKPTDKPELINVAGMKKVCDMVQELTEKIAGDKERPEYVKGATGPSTSGGGPKIGFRPAEYDDDETRGVPVADVNPGGPAETGGIKKGDWIIEIAGQPVQNMQGYMKAMSTQKVGQAMEVTVKRGDMKLKLKVTPQ